MRWDSPRPSCRNAAARDGSAEILVQLPGVDDPARIKQLIQTAALLELYEVKDGPFAEREEARAKHGGVLPLNTKLLKGAGRGEQDQRLAAGDPQPGYHGSDLRDAQPGAGRDGQVGNQFRR